MDINKILKYKTLSFFFIFGYTMKTKYKNLGEFFFSFFSLLATEKTSKSLLLPKKKLISLYGEFPPVKITLELRMIWRSAN
jgi:hypothetical protein